MVFWLSVVGVLAALLVLAAVVDRADRRRGGRRRIRIRPFRNIGDAKLRSSPVDWGSDVTRDDEQGPHR